MALGGWIYHTMLVPSFDHTNDTLFESNVVDPLISLLSGMSGWSLGTAKTKYQSDSGWFFTVTHSGGATLAVVVVGTAGSVTYVHINNTQWMTGAITTSANCRVILSYWPPGHSGAGAANPSLDGYVPSDGFGFMWGSRESGIYSGHTTRFHVMARGDDLIFVSEYDSQNADLVSLMGTAIEPYHAADSGSRKAEVHGMLYHSTLSGGVMPGTYFAADNATRIYNNGTLCLNTHFSTLLSTSVNNAAPWIWLPGVVGRPLSYGATGHLYVGVTSTSGLKGQISDEWLRFTVASGGPVSKQQLSSGALIHASDGKVLGWDSGNGAMS